MSLDFTIPLALAALLIEALAGYPSLLYRLLGHPVTWLGALLKLLERALNQPDWPNEARRIGGVLALLLLLGVAGGLALAVTRWLEHGLAGALVLALLAATLPAQQSLFTHVAATADALEIEDLEAGRRAVGLIVGRDTNVLDEAGVARAAIESLAENFSDGIVAPAFWTAVLGLPGGVVYKAVNTADSMIGHRNERYAFFGWAAARFDDLVNLPASRLSALWLVIAAIFVDGADRVEAMRAVARDARQHRSPNAGWPEAAMAGALGLKLAGPRVYGGVPVDDVYMGRGRSRADAKDIRRALQLYRLACGAQIGALAILVVILRA
jgi:adenosylcobinamide-phosphate synthase